MNDLSEILVQIQEIGRALNHLQGDDPEAVRGVLERIARGAREIDPSSHVTVLSLDPAGGAIETLLGPTPVGDELRLAREAVEARRMAGSGGVIALPLVDEGQAIGALIVTGGEAPLPEDARLPALEALASLAALALGRARTATLAAGEQARRERALRRLHRAGMLISSRSNLKDTLDAILKMALEITDASYGIFRLVDSTGGNLVTRSFAGQVQTHPATEILPISSHSVMGTVALKREPVVISDLRLEPWRSTYYPLDYALEMRSELAVPLIGASGRLEGVLNLESPEVNAFDKEDRYILQILAAQAVVAIEGIRLVDALQDISETMTVRTLQEVHQALAERACDLLNLPVALIWLIEKDQLVVQAGSEAGLVGRRIQPGEDAVSRSIQRGEPVFLLDAPSPLAGAGDRNGSALIVPLITSENPRPVGAFAVYTAPGETRDFSQADWDTKVLSILAHYAALAIQTSAHIEALRFSEDQRATTDTFAAIGEIAANLLHRLNNKVGTIPVRVEGIQDKCAGLLESDTYLADNLDEIQRSASEAMRVVHESLDYLRPIQLRPVSVAASIREAIGAVKLPGTIQVECQEIEDLPPVQAGANRLALVFSNLLENAADAMQNRGKIRIAGAEWGHWVEIRVSDTGPGIPPELHERIFEFSYSSRSSSHPGNLGFGLWWVKSFMTRFGGKVAVESDGSTGTTFILSLPVAQEDA